MNSLLRFVLSGSAVGVVAIMVASGCSSDSDGGTPTEGGDSGGGTAGSSGSPSKGGSTGNQGGNGNGGSPEAGTGGTDAPGGASPGGSDAGGSGGAAAGSDTGGVNAGGMDAGGANAGGGGAGAGVAVGKFCNPLTFGEAEESTTFRIDIGEGAAKVSFTADSFECTPIVGTACTPLPVGENIPVALFDLDDPSAPVDEKTIDILDGEEIYFEADAPEGLPVINAFTSNTLVCQNTDYTDIY